MSRAALALFAGIAVLAVALVAWWIVFLLRVGGERWVFMFATEGSFFIALLLVGVFLMYRTLVEQVRLREQRATFFSAVTHELKTPIAAIRLFLETIEADRVDAEKRKDLVRKMLLDCDRLERAVAQLLRAGQIEAGALAPACDEVDLPAIGREVVEAARPRLGPGERIDLDLPPAPESGEVRARGDGGLLRNAIENLVDNAIRYSSAPRAILVRVWSAASEVGVEVRDGGPGVDPAFVGRAFEPFRRGGDDEARRAKGTGLGLFIVRGVAEAHGGKAYIRGLAPGGTAAGFSIPIRSVP